MDDRVRFYIDIHIGHGVTDALREQGIDVARADEIGLHDAPDLEHLQAAHAQGRVIVTKDADFQALHRSGIEHSGIAYLPQRAGIGYITGQLLLMYMVCSAKDMLGKIEYL